MTTGLAIPTMPDEITPSWLTDALRAGGLIPDGAVTSVTGQMLGEGAGFIGQLARLTLTYDHASPGAPATIIAKMPALDPGARAVAGLYGLYEREFRFYRELAPEITFRTARCFYSAGDAKNVEYVLLLEDLGASGHAGDQVTGCGAAEARLALSQLAEHHARWWSSPRLAEIDWLTPGVDLVNVAMEHAYPAAWPKAVELFPAHMSPAIRNVLPTLGERLTRLMEPFSEGPLTLTHGDYRLDNMFFGNAGSDYQLAVLDWQSPSKGWGAYDIAYFLYGNLDVATRRAHEDEALRAYHATLVTNGVQGYEFEQLMDDYRSSLLVSLGIWIVNAASLDVANERGKALFDLFFERLVAAITDHNALERLPA